MSAAERRRAVRVPVAFFINRYVEGVPYLYHVSNISEAGLLVKPMWGPLHAAEDVVLEMELPGQDEVTCVIGRVAHHDAQGLGVSLEGETPARLHAVKRCVDYVMTVSPQV